MDELLRQVLKERSQLREHAKDGELHTYIDDNRSDLDQLLSRIINQLTKGDEQNAA